VTVKSRHDVEVGNLIYVQMVNMFGAHKVLAEVTYVNIYAGVVRAYCEDGEERGIMVRDILEVA
jgi:hypothetical protein